MFYIDGSDVNIIRVLLNFPNNKFYFAIRMLKTTFSKGES